jgi:hypothetical protein
VAAAFDGEDTCGEGGEEGEGEGEVEGGGGEEDAGGGEGGFGEGPVGGCCVVVGGGEGEGEFGAEGGVEEEGALGVLVLGILNLGGGGGYAGVGAGDDCPQRGEKEGCGCLHRECLPSDLKYHNNPKLPNRSTYKTTITPLHPPPSATSAAYIYSPIPTPYFPRGV